MKTYDFETNPFARKYKNKLASRLPFDAEEVQGDVKKIDWWMVAIVVLAAFSFLYFGGHLALYLMGAYAK